MKLLSLVFIIATIHCAHCVANKNDNVKTSLDEQWRKYKIEFKRNYNNEEDKMRFKLYQETVKQINEHNIKFKKGLVPVEAGFNEYSDWTDVEKTKLLR